MRLNAATAGAELAEIHRLAHGTQVDTPLEPIAVVVSSLSGGTGAGLLLDTCDLLRQLPGTWARNSFGMLYASDVFQHLGDLATAGVQPNALSALSEVMNGYWLTANQPRASALFQLAGAPIPLAKSGPAFPFLVGAANTKGVTFGDQRSVYAMMGRALRSWTTDPTVQVELIEYTKANWQNNAAGNAVKADVVMRDHQPVFEAFGYAEVSLGVERFEQYAAERLARDRRDMAVGSPPRARPQHRPERRPAAGGDHRRPRPPAPRAVPPRGRPPRARRQRQPDHRRARVRRRPRASSPTAPTPPCAGDRRGPRPRRQRMDGSDHGGAARRRRGVRAPLRPGAARGGPPWVDEAPQRMIDVTVDVSPATVCRRRRDCSSSSSTS